MPLPCTSLPYELPYPLISFHYSHLGTNHQRPASPPSFHLSSDSSNKDQLFHQFSPFRIHTIFLIYLCHPTYPNRFSVFSSISSHPKTIPPITLFSSVRETLLPPISHSQTPTIGRFLNNDVDFYLVSELNPKI